MKKYPMETIVGIFVLMGILCIGYMTMELGNVNIFGDKSYTIYAGFTSVSGLKINNPVEMFGLEIGSVDGFEMDQEKQLIIVKLKIDNGIRIYEDAIVSIKTSGLIGDRYVSVNPGGASDILSPESVIIDTEPPVDIGDIIGKYAFGNVLE